jgi:hypothetical protein
MKHDEVPAELLERYATGNPAIVPDELWAVEAHLEGCAICRDRLGEAVQRHSPATTALLARVADRLATEIAISPTMPRRRRAQVLGRSRWLLPPGLLARLAMTVLLVLAALGLDLVDQQGRGEYPSLVLLFAPVAPLLGVAAVWSRRLDPAYEFVMASPRAGLYLVLRRTLVALVVVIPALAAAGLPVGASPARWLLPCLAFTAGALALGEVIGLSRAAIGLAAAWVIGVVGPSMLTATSPELLEPAMLPVWAALTAVVAIVLALRRNAYTGLRSGR